MSLTADEAVVAALCLTGDWVLIDRWLLAARPVRIEAQLFNSCDVIEEVCLFPSRSPQWLRGLCHAPSGVLDASFTVPSLASGLLARVGAARLEGATMLHCAALSGEASMVRPHSLTRPLPHTAAPTSRPAIFTFTC
jgi:hypothetical protein